MNRREFLRFAVLLFCTIPCAATAQQPGKIPVVGVLWHAASEEEEGVFFRIMRDALADAGYISGKNILLEDRYPAESLERFASYAAELARLKVDVIVTNAAPATLAAKRATFTLQLSF
jgi:putative ABC transport system substrate-binding protein